MEYAATAWRWVRSSPERLWSQMAEAAREAKKLGQDDPRRIVHSFKVGLALALVSLFYYFDDPLYEGYGLSAMWAVLTVVVVFEFSVGATLGKGINRGLATLLAGWLGVGAHRLASFPGEKAEPILLGIFVFLLATLVTFMRFFPRLKARHDYGLVIFILTFCLICVSAYRDDQVLRISNMRLSTVLIGGATAVAVCVFIYPVWAGDDLHNSVALNMEKLASFLEGFGNEYLEGMECKAFQEEYKSVLNSKGTEESLANFARWEPRHGRFRYRHPWNQYLKIGSLTRQCAYRIEALNGYLNSPHKASSPQIREKIEEPSRKMATECSYSLMELALAMKTMTKPCLADSHVENSKAAAENLRAVLETAGSWEDVGLPEIIPAATVASLVMDVVGCTEKIAEAVNKLASMARFRDLEASKAKENRTMQSRSSFSGSPRHGVIVIDTPTQAAAE